MRPERSVPEHRVPDNDNEEVVKVAEADAGESNASRMNEEEMKTRGNESTFGGINKRSEDEEMEEQEDAVMANAETGYDWAEQVIKEFQEKWRESGETDTPTAIQYYFMHFARAKQGASTTPTTRTVEECYAAYQQYEANHDATEFVSSQAKADAKRNWTQEIIDKFEEVEMTAEDNDIDEEDLKERFLKFVGDNYTGSRHQAEVTYGIYVVQKRSRGMPMGSWDPPVPGGDRPGGLRDLNESPMRTSEYTRDTPPEGGRVEGLQEEPQKQEWLKYVDDEMVMSREQAADAYDRYMVNSAKTSAEKSKEEKKATSTGRYNTLQENRYGYKSGWGQQYRRPKTGKGNEGYGRELWRQGQQVRMPDPMELLTNYIKENEKRVQDAAEEEARARDREAESRQYTEESGSGDEVMQDAHATSSATPTMTQWSTAVEQPACGKREEEKDDPELSRPLAESMQRCIHGNLWCMECNEGKPGERTPQPGMVRCDHCLGWFKGWMVHPGPCVNAKGADGKKNRFCDVCIPYHQLPCGENKLCVWAEHEMLESLWQKESDERRRRRARGEDDDVRKVDPADGKSYDKFQLYKKYHTSMSVEQRREYWVYVCVVEEKPTAPQAEYESSDDQGQLTKGQHARRVIANMQGTATGRQILQDMEIQQNEEPTGRSRQAGADTKTAGAEQVKTEEEESSDSETSSDATDERDASCFGKAKCDQCGRIVWKNDLAPLPCRFVTVPQRYPYGCLFCRPFHEGYCQVGKPCTFEKEFVEHRELNEEATKERRAARAKRRTKKELKRISDEKKTEMTKDASEKKETKNIDKGHNESANIEGDNDKGREVKEVSAKRKDIDQEEMESDEEKYEAEIQQANGGKTIDNGEIRVNSKGKEVTWQEIKDKFQKSVKADKLVQFWKNLDKKIPFPGKTQCKERGCHVDVQRQIADIDGERWCRDHRLMSQEEPVWKDSDTRKEQRRYDAWGRPREEVWELQPGEKEERHPLPESHPWKHKSQAEREFLYMYERVFCSTCAEATTRQASTFKYEDEKNEGRLICPRCAKQGRGKGRIEAHPPVPMSFRADEDSTEDEDGMSKGGSLMRYIKAGDGQSVRLMQVYLRKRHANEDEKELLRLYRCEQFYKQHVFCEMCRGNTTREKATVIVKEKSKKIACYGCYLMQCDKAQAAPGKETFSPARIELPSELGILKFKTPLIEEEVIHWDGEVQRTRMTNPVTEEELPLRGNQYFVWFDYTFPDSWRKSRKCEGEQCGKFSSEGYLGILRQEMTQPTKTLWKCSSCGPFLRPDERVHGDDEDSGEPVVLGRRELTRLPLRRPKCAVCGKQGSLKTCEMCTRRVCRASTVYRNYKWWCTRCIPMDARLPNDPAPCKRESGGEQEDNAMDIEETKIEYADAKVKCIAKARVKEEAEQAAIEKMQSKQGGGGDERA